MSDVVLEERWLRQVVLLYQHQVSWSQQGSAFSASLYLPLRSWIIPVQALLPFSTHLETTTQWILLVRPSGWLWWEVTFLCQMLLWSHSVLFSEMHCTSCHCVNLSAVYIHRTECVFTFYLSACLACSSNSGSIHREFYSKVSIQLSIAEVCTYLKYSLEKEWLLIR